MPYAANQKKKPLPPEAYDLENVPDEYIEEALAFHDYCEASFNMNQHYDCRCLSAKYLDKKIEGGEGVDRSAIMMSLETECADATQAAGARYQECLNNQLLHDSDQPPEELCTCFANQYARIYERLAPEPNSRTFVAIETQAMISCQNPELARRLYYTGP